MAYGLGRRFAPDERDRRHLMQAVLPAVQIPSYRFYRTGKILDQGATPQCVGYSWRQFLASAPTMTKDGPSAPEIYHGAQLNDEWPGEDYDGSSVRGGAKYLQGVGRLSRYVWAWDAQTVAAFILSGQGGVVVGSNWYEAMFDPTRENGYTVEIGGGVAGGHAYYLSGYNATRGAFRITNSWGIAWADHGRAWLQGEDLDRLLREEGEACAAVEQR